MVQDEQTRIVVRVHSNASENKLLCFRGGVLQIRIAAPPIKGRANRELIKFLSGIFGISKSKLTIEKGMTSKTKVIAISELTQKQIIEQLERLGVGEENAPADEAGLGATFED